MEWKIDKETWEKLKKRSLEEVIEKNFTQTSPQKKYAISYLKKTEWLLNLLVPYQKFQFYSNHYHPQIKNKGKTKDAVIYSVLMITLEGKKEMAGFHIFMVKRINKIRRSIFNDLI